MWTFGSGIAALKIGDRGIHNVMGNWHACRKIYFCARRDPDVSISNLMAFSVVNNTSIEFRKCFLDFSSGHTWGAPTSITGNHVFDPTGDWAMVLDNAGPYLVVDNTLRLGEKTRGIRIDLGRSNVCGKRVYGSKQKRSGRTRPLPAHRREGRLCNGYS